MTTQVDSFLHPGYDYIGLGSQRKTRSNFQPTFRKGMKSCNRSGSADQSGRKWRVPPMTVERALRGIAGAFILASVALAFFHSRNWLYFTGFVGLNLLQSAFTNWCPMVWLLQKVGLRRESPLPEGALESR